MRRASLAPSSSVPCTLPRLTILTKDLVVIVCGLLVLGLGSGVHASFVHCGAVECPSGSHNNGRDVSVPNSEGVVTCCSRDDNDNSNSAVVNDNGAVNNNGANNNNNGANSNNGANVANDNGAEMDSQGMALAYTRYSRYYLPNQNEAHAAGAGMFAGDFMPPWEWRRK